MPFRLLYPILDEHMNKYLLILAFAGFNTFLTAEPYEDLFAELREETQEYYDYTFPEPTPVLEPIFDEKGIINDVPNKLYSHQLIRLCKLL